LNAERLSWIARGKFAEGERRNGKRAFHDSCTPAECHIPWGRVPGASLRLRPPQADLPLAILFEPFGLAEYRLGGDPGVGSSVV